MLKTVLILFIAGAFIYPFRYRAFESFRPIWHSVSRAPINSISNLVENVRSNFFPCTSPLKYSVGAFDDEFGITRESFLDAILNAEAIWEEPLSLSLFNYAPESGHLKINLIYDYRQQATDKLRALGLSVKNDRATYESLKTKYLSLKNDYEAAKANFEKRVLAFETSRQYYEQQVSHWNAKGGAPRNDYIELERLRKELENESGELRVIQGSLNEVVEQINSLVVVLNGIADSLNLSGDRYNSIGASLGESFEEGVYRSGPDGQEIDIFEFSSREKLVRVLAHELGHALGLDHVQEQQAVMYEFNDGENESLSSTDLAQLKVKCGIK